MLHASAVVHVIADRRFLAWRTRACLRETGRSRLDRSNSRVASVRYSIDEINARSLARSSDLCSSRGGSSILEDQDRIAGGRGSSQLASRENSLLDRTSFSDFRFSPPLSRRRRLSTKKRVSLAWPRRRFSISGHRLREGGDELGHRATNCKPH